MYAFITYCSSGFAELRVIETESKRVGSSVVVASFLIFKVPLARWYKIAFDKTLDEAGVRSVSMIVARICYSRR